MEKNIVVIGGGLAGLSCAVALADAGLRVTVLERSERLGGRAGSWTDSVTGDAVDIGPHVLHTEYHNMLALLKRLATETLVTWQPDPVLTLASKPRHTVLRHWPLPAPLSLLPGMLPAPGLSVRDYLSMNATSWHAMQFGEEEIPELDRMSARDYLGKMGVSGRMIEWWWAFAAMVVTNVPVERCSAGSLMRIHAQLSNHGGVHFGFAAAGLGELYAAQAADAIRAAGGAVVMRSEARALLGTGRAEGVVLADGTQLPASCCISAVPPHELAQLLPGAWKEQPPFNALMSFEPSPYISCYLWFDRRVMNERFIAHLWSPQRLNYDFYDLSRIRRGWKHRPSVIASNIIYSHRAHGMDDDEIVRATVAEIAEFAPQVMQAKLQHARVHRIPMAIPCPVVGNESRRPQTRTPIPGLFLAGDWVQTHLPYSMESAVASGWLAAEAVLHDLGRPRTLVRPQRPYDGIARVVRSVTARYRRGSGRRQSPGG